MINVSCYVGFGSLSARLKLCVLNNGLAVFSGKCRLQKLWRAGSAYCVVCLRNHLLGFQGIPKSDIGSSDKLGVIEIPP